MEFSFLPGLCGLKALCLSLVPAWEAGRKFAEKFSFWKTFCFSSPEKFSEKRNFGVCRKAVAMAARLNFLKVLTRQMSSPRKASARTVYVVVASCESIV